MPENSSEHATFVPSFLPDEKIEKWTSRLASGETGKEVEGFSRAILMDFVMRASFGRAQSAFTLEWLANAFDDIFDYKDPRTALTLGKRAKHRPAGIGAERAANVAWWVALAIDRGYREPEANTLAAERFACEPRSVLRMRKQAADWVPGNEPGIRLGRILPSPAPAIAATINAGR